MSKKHGNQKTHKGRGPHRSSFSYFFRHLKPSEQSKEKPKEHWDFKGYIGLFGPRIDASVKDVEGVPESYIKQRHKRDGESGHITLFLKRDIKVVLENAEKVSEWKDLLNRIKEKRKNSPKADIHMVLDLISECIVDDWKDLGLGKVTDKKTGNEAYFKVVQWESANAFRKKVGLPPKDFHITVGFRDGDIHDVPKGVDQLINKSNSQ